MYFFLRIHPSINPLPLLIRAINFPSCTIQITPKLEKYGNLAQWKKKLSSWRCQTSYDDAQASPISLTNSPCARKRKCLYRASCRRSRCSSHPRQWLRNGRYGPSTSKGFQPLTKSNSQASSAFPPPNRAAPPILRRDTCLGRPAWLSESSRGGLCSRKNSTRSLKAATALCVQRAAGVVHL